MATTHLPIMSRADYAKMQLKGWYEQAAARKAATKGKVSGVTAASTAAKKTALDALAAKNKAASTAAQQTLATPAGSAGVYNAGSLAPLQAVTGVEANPGFAGANNALASFYLTPESTQSQFAVGAPVGGGNIGTRQRASSGSVKSDSGKLGGKGKDEL